MFEERKNRLTIIATMLFVCVAALMIIAISAKSATLQYEINTLNKQIQEAERDIQTLQVKIKTASNINNLETRAMQIGLVYPVYTQIVYLDDENSSVEELALALKETVYKH